MSVTAARGFLAAGLASGIKPSGDADLALVVSADGPVPAAAVFTTNRAAAAPVQVSREHLATTNGRVAAVILNSGCANAATGEGGLSAAARTCAAVAGELSVDEDEILVCSTGLIGTLLPLEALLSAVPSLVASLGSDAAAGTAAARAIMTTDTHPKEVLVRHGGVVVGGMAKGAGMIAPNMATMLAVLTTDAAASPEELAVALRHAVDDSFNALTVDGCTSTNDTVIVLASGQARETSHADLVDGLTAACFGLAEQLAEDAEGTTKVAVIKVLGAPSEAEARRAARRVGESLLVKTSLFGADPYWGRVVSELGASGAPFELDRVSVAYGSTVVFAGGNEQPHDRAAVAAYLASSRVELVCDLGLGDFGAQLITTDLGHGYIEENMRTS